jgi:Carboxypeptidase regulatory-like domain
LSLFLLYSAVFTAMFFLCALPSPAQSSTVILPAPASSQQQAILGTANISGTVLDPSGAEVVGAQVILESKDHSSKLTISTGNDGQFSFANVPPAEYQLSVTARGFATHTSAAVLVPGQFLIAPTITLAPAQANTAVEVTATQMEVAEAQVKIQEKQRIIGFIPNFYVTYLPDPAPLGKKQKFELATRTMIDPVTLGITAITAGIQQSQNAYSDYGQGAAGYAKRFGASYADDATDTFLGGAVFPTLFHQDPRYFYKGTGSTRSRLLRAVGSVVVAKGDNKHWQPNYSGLLGSLAAGGISNLYYPNTDRGLGLIFTNFALNIGSGAGFNILQEFVIKKFTPAANKNSQNKR